MPTDEQLGDAVGQAKQHCEESMDVWEVVERALHNLSDEENYGEDSYPADVEVRVRVE